MLSLLEDSLLAPMVQGVERLLPCRMRVGLPRASVLERFSSKDGLAADRKEAACLMDAMHEHENFRTGPRIPDIRIRTEVPGNHGKHSPSLTQLHTIKSATSATHAHRHAAGARSDLHRFCDLLKAA